jgi:cbb3-type cytochrome oxidase subunit 3
MTLQLGAMIAFAVIGVVFFVAVWVVVFRARRKDEPPRQ